MSLCSVKFFKFTLVSNHGDCKNGTPGKSKEKDQSKLTSKKKISLQTGREGIGGEREPDRDRNCILEFIMTYLWVSHGFPGHKGSATGMVGCIYKGKHKPL